MKLLVCGGRDYGRVPDIIAPGSRDYWTRRASQERQLLIETLDGLLREVTSMVHGGARGADSLAGDWAYVRGIAVTVYRAQWGVHGLAAGPIRNMQMLEQEKPDAVLAFPGGRGTADMVIKAKLAGVRVIEVKSIWEVRHG
jgi:hypothetical protein